MKISAGTINAIPNKRIFLSIIADYDLRRAICELVDNPLDNWTKRGKKRALKISITLNVQQQTIQVEDDSGGIPESALELIVSPGATSNTIDDNTIGIFGVGTKRAVVALAQDVTNYHEISVRGYLPSGI